MCLLRVRELLSSLAVISLVACGGGGASTTPLPPNAVEQPFSTTGDTGAGGAESYLSSFGTAADRTQIRKSLASKTFLVAESLIDSFANYSYNDWGQGHDCTKGGYHGGHAGIDYQTKSVVSTVTADEPIYSVSAGTFVGYRTHTWGITAIVRSTIRAAGASVEADYYFHYLHLRSQVATLQPGDTIAVGQNIGVQGSLTPTTPNNAEHVHLEIALQELEFGRGAHPAMCTSAVDATLDPYPVLSGLFANGSTTANIAPTALLSSSSGATVQTGQTYTLTFKVSDANTNLSYVDVNWNDGTAIERKAVSGGSTTVAFSRSFSVARTINWSASAYDTSAAASSQVRGSFTVTTLPPANRAPTLSLSSSSGASVQTGQIYTLTFNASDADTNLSYVDVNWNDGTAIERKAVSGGATTIAFSRSFSSVRTINWSATAYDTATVASSQVQGLFSVSTPSPANRVPVLSLSSSSGAIVQTGQTYSLTFNVSDADTNLSYVDVNWNDGTAVERTAVSGSSTIVMFTRSFATAGTINWSATAYDTAAAASSMLQGTFTITAPTITLNSAAKTGNLVRLFPCPSGATTCVQAGVTLAGSSFSGFDFVKVDWSGTRGSGSFNFPANSLQITLATASTIVIWPHVFDNTDPVGTCYTWTFSVLKGPTTTASRSLSTGQICRPSGI